MSDRLAVKAQEFLCSVQGLASIEALEGAFLAMTGELGFTDAAYYRLYEGGRTHPRTLMFGRPPRDAVETYRSKSFAARDPRNAVAFRSTSAFTWDEALASARSPAAAEVIKEARCFAADGLVTPVRSGLDELGVCILYASERIAAGAYERLLLEGISAAFSRRGLALLKGEVEEAPTALTAREAECLQLVACGHSDQEIATVLQRSFNTIHTHVESLRSKLKARSRAQLILRATMSGLLPVGDPGLSAQTAPALAAPALPEA